jgi:hypothetical protein
VYPIADASVRGAAFDQSLNRGLYPAVWGREPFGWTQSQEPREEITSIRDFVLFGLVELKILTLLK